MTKKNILFIVLISLFVLTAAITLLGVLKIIVIDDFYLKGLFAAFLLELAATVFTIATKGNILEESAPKKSEAPKTASLTLHIWGDHRAPKRVAFNNIFRWYYLQNIMNGITESGESVTQHVMSTLFVSFEADVAISTITVQSPDMALPVYEVKEFNQRFAIIVFSGAVGPGTLEVRVTA